MILQFLQAYAELVTEMTAVGGPQHHDLTGDLKKDERSVADWLHHLELNIPYYAADNRSAVYIVAVAVMDAWKTWNSMAAARQALWDMLCGAITLYGALTDGDIAKSCTLTEAQAMLLYQRELVDCAETTQSYAEWKAAGKVAGIVFTISSRFRING